MISKSRIKRILGLSSGSRLTHAWYSLGLHKHMVERRRVAILSYSDIEPDLARQISWGDFWFKHEMIKAIGGLGFAVVELDSCYRPDIVIHLFGYPINPLLFSSTYKVLWIHSNPSRLYPKYLEQYDRIYCISELFADKIREWGFECTVVQQGTSKRPIPGLVLQHDIVFIGNARADLGGKRQIVEDMGQPEYDFKVWGSGYRSLNERYWAGNYVDNSDLSILYGISRISLNDHTPAMAAMGFINPRVFDILAAGGFCISDQNPAIAQLFDDAVPQYTSSQHLQDLVKYYLLHPQEREILARKGQSIAAKYTWSKVAATLLEGISAIYDK